MSGVKLLTMREWEALPKYCCTLPTGPKVGFVYTRGPHVNGSDPTKDPWFYVEVCACEQEGYVDHVPTPIRVETPRERQIRTLEAKHRSTVEIVESLVEAGFLRL